MTTTQNGLAAAEAAERRAKLFSICGDADIIVATTPENVFYISGYWSMGADTSRCPKLAAVANRDKVLLVAPAADQGPAFEVFDKSEDVFPFGQFHFDAALLSGKTLQKAAGDFHSALSEALEELTRLNALLALDCEIDGDVAAHIQARHPRLQVVSRGDAFIGSRATKTMAEIERLSRAAAVAERALEEGMAMASANVSEWEIAGTIASGIVGRGGVPGFIVVTSGPRSALADAYPSHRKLERGDVVRFDIGCRVEGYWADTARTAVVGEPSHFLNELYRMTSTGTLALTEQIRAGMTAREAYSTALEAVRAAGLPSYERHHCGHGIGLEPHEFPTISPTNTARLEAGMVLCIETPLYQLNGHGMMIEDTVVLGNDHAQLLTSLSREMRVL